MTKEEFEKNVKEGIESIPKEFLEKLNNVAIVIEDNPTRQQIEKLKMRKGWSLFGLYEGVPQTRRGINYSGVLPDKITIFQKPIEEAANTNDEIKEIIRDTVWHEIAHHFGMDEKMVRESEEKRREKKKS